jgi:hypothetical protein
MNTKCRKVIFLEESSSNAESKALWERAKPKEYDFRDITLYSPVEHPTNLTWFAYNGK